MARKLKTDEALSALGALADGPLTDNARQVIRAALTDTQSNILVAKAASVAAKLGGSDLAPDMARAFDRLMRNGAKADKACLAKTEIVKALNELGVGEEAVFLCGVSYRQIEPVFGGKSDVADTLRSECALGLARMGYQGIFFVLVSLLMDPEISPRRAAVTVLRALPCETSELLLRMKILSGDSDLVVTGDAIHALMEIAPESSVDFVGALISPNDLALAEEAALAMGQSREKEAYDLLRARWDENADSRFKVLLLFPIGLIQSDEAFEFLIEVLLDRARCYSAQTAKALGICALGNESRRRRLQEILAENDDLDVDIDV